ADPYDSSGKHEAAVINEGQEHRLWLLEIVPGLSAAAGLVTEGEVQRHLPVKRRFEPHVLQNRGHGRSRGAGTGRNRLRAQRGASGEQERGSRDDMVNFLHGAISSSPSKLRARGTNPFPRRSSSHP